MSRPLLPAALALLPAALALLPAAPRLNGRLALAALLAVVAALIAAAALAGWPLPPAEDGLQRLLAPFRWPRNPAAA